jgi:hypothetical protein
LVTQLFLSLDKLLSKYFDIGIFLLQLSLSLLGDLLFDAEYFFQNFDVLLERTRYLFVLFQFFGQEYFHILQNF